MNRCNFVGRLTRDPELKETPSGTKVCTFNVALDRPISKEAKERGVQSADFPTCVAWGAQADYLAAFGDKGDRVEVEARVQTRNYDDRDGKKVYVTEFKVDQIRVLSDGWVEHRTQEAEAKQNRTRHREMTFNGEPLDTESSWGEPIPGIESDELPFY